MHNQIPKKTYEYIQAKTGLSYYLINKYCNENNIKPKRQSRPLSNLTKKRLEKVSKINASKKTQKQIAEILGFKTRTSCYNFIKKHNIEYKLSHKNSVSQKRLDILAGIKKLKKMSVEDIADKLRFEGKYSNQYTRKFLKDNNIDING